MTLGIRFSQRFLLCGIAGKSLVLAHLLFAQATFFETSVGRLVCNEVDSKRRLRLLTVLKAYCPRPLLAPEGSCIRVTGRDGKWWGNSPSTGPHPGGTEGGLFDKVLVDAPCSSERHVVQQAACTAGGPTKADWSLKRCHLIAKEQVKLVMSGLKAVKVGGLLVYSTCSIAALQNDGVIDKVLIRAGGAVEVVHHNDSSTPQTLVDGTLEERLLAQELEGFGAERTRHGWMILPDATGWGPIYLAVLRKRAEVEIKRVKVNKYAAVEEGV
jgi:hypothetical protein